MVEIDISNKKVHEIDHVENDLTIKVDVEMVTNVVSFVNIIEIQEIDDVEKEPIVKELVDELENFRKD